jgi:hypothetical protein
MKKPSPSGPLWAIREDILRSMAAEFSGLAPEK